MTINNKKINSDDIRDRWENLGIAFVGNDSKLKNSDPERAIIASLQDFQRDRKLLGLILSWLSEFGDLLHLERIKALARDLSAFELAWLGGIAAHQRAGGDHRWQVLGDWVKKKLGKPLPQFPSSRLDELQAQKNGADPYFSDFGIIIPKIFPADLKKLRARFAVIQGNLWLKMRLLFGTNWRADIAATILLNLAKTSYQVEKILGCSRETAYRNWKALKEADLEGIFNPID